MLDWVSLDKPFNMKIAVSHPRTYEKLHCKGEPYSFCG